MIRRLESASLIVVVSVSRYFLHMARVLLAPAVGRRHSLRAHLAAGGWPDRLGAADVVLCDLIWYPVVRARCQSGTVLLHRVMAESCLEEIARNLSAAPSWQLPSDARVQAG